jgi:hypothetical protein
MNTKLWLKVLRLETDIAKLKQEVRILFWINAVIEIPLLILILSKLL